MLENLTKTLEDQLAYYESKKKRKKVKKLKARLEEVRVKDLFASVPEKNYLYQQ